MDVLFVVLVWVTMGYITSRLAAPRGRDPARWFLLGMLFGVFAMGALYLLPNLKQEEPKLELPPLQNEEQPNIFEDLGDEWFYIDRQKVQKGPVTLIDLSLAWGDGVINEDSYVWKEGMIEWKQVRDLMVLKEFLSCDAEPKTEDA